VAAFRISGCADSAHRNYGTVLARGNAQPRHSSPAALADDGVVPRFQVKVHAGGAAAEVVVAPGRPETADLLRAALQRAGVVHGVDEAAIAAVVAAAGDGGYAGRRIVATASPPEPGVDACLVLSHPLGLTPGLLHPDQRLDYHERHGLHPVTAGTEVARIVTATAGRPGRNVLGGELPAKPGRPFLVRLGAGVGRQGDTLVATRNGVVAQAADAIDVVDLHQHRGDVGYATGNLHTDGSLHITGDVGPGFEATARHDVTIDGAVCDGTVHAGGRVRIGLGAMGPATMVRAGGDAHCHHATSASFVVGGALTFADGASHTLSQATTIDATDGRGRLFGGDHRARTTIRVRHAGTVAGALTMLRVGDLGEASIAFVRSHHAAVAQVERRQQRERQRGDRSGKRNREALRVAMPADSERLRLRQLQRELLQLANVVVDGTLHVGVRLCFGDHTTVPDHDRHHVRFRWHPTEHRVVEEPLP
jgi:uncharacterized protein (DUF342 family)